MRLSALKVRGSGPFIITASRDPPALCPIMTSTIDTESQPSFKRVYSDLDEPAANAPPLGGQYALSQILPIIGALCLALFLSAFELSAVSTALPTIVHSIPGYRAQDFIWLGSAYSLAATAFLPLSGALAQVFGRRPVVLGSLALFTLGSALCGAAKVEAHILAGRAIQGVGGGGIHSMSYIVLADLVPLQKRGKYNAFIGLTWSFASVLGPVLGGLLAQKGAWRWLFYLNIPACAIVALLVIRYLNLKTPKESLLSNLRRLDFVGNLVVVGSTTACVLALAWAGSSFSWHSVQVLAPLCLGLIGLIAFFAYEAVYAKHPMVPSLLWSNRTSISGYIQTFVLQVTLLCLIYYLPVYFQACKLASPVKSGLDLFGLALTIAPVSIVVGLSVAKFRCYRPQIWVGWSIMILSMGLLSTVKETSDIWLSIGYTNILGAGIGTVYTTSVFPVLAPLPVSANAQALSLVMFLRLFGQVWGITIGGVILQNGLADLPAEVVAVLPPGGDIAYGSIAVLPTMPLVLQAEVRSLFASSLSTLWQVMAGLSGIGLLSSLMMKAVPMHTYTDEKWGVAEDEQSCIEKP
ncbi:hypothetical protein E1B28_003766 [Marasmius oreades]|uniref:Major facilitator superfamily (MFS) profile domain-containing protein n=2 Tax=Marasmius oreades TaxID=181124 RepID=A0A9P7UX47_9AGAR|nr:uncharacterized protein E1B28_003766 [Marasmius oreades]KAG7096321.1 hypothetical protein E1B28_003766 [Marasmius oreades]